MSESSGSQASHGRRLALGLLLLATLAAAGSAARADGAPPASTPPGPDDARGYKAPPHERGEGALLVPRLLLLPVRAGMQLAMIPVKAAAGALSPTGVFDRMARAHERGTYLIPVALVDPSFGANLGLRAGQRSPFDRQGVVTCRAAVGGTQRMVFSLTLRSRDAHLLPYRAGWSYKLMAKYERLPDKHFCGLGNLSRRIDLAYYTLRQYLFLGALRYAPAPWMACDLTAAVHRNQVDAAAYPEEGRKSIELGFDEGTAPGLYVDPQNIQGEVALTLDRRDSRGAPHQGWKAEGFFGYAKGTGPDAVNFVHYGVEGQGFLPLARSHTLLLRVAGEEVRTNGTSPIKLTERPSLGGRSTLRGYLADRFTDNASAFGSAEYRYRLSPLITACAFVDVGKVMPRLLDIDASDLHRSFGAGLDFARADQFYFRLLGARSDEDFVFTATLEPVFDRQDRRERR
jgi:hypothetical protein